MNIDTVEQIVALISRHPVSEITVEQDGARVHVRRPASVLNTAPTEAPPVVDTATLGAAALDTPAAEAGPPSETQAAAEAEAILLTSPMVGLFHHLAQPVPYGGLIALHQTVGSIESMKLLTDVQAEHGGRVMEVLVEDGAPVEYGQPLFRLAAP